MTDTPQNATSAKTDRAERLAQALRANLRRRKTQTRGRAEAEAPPEPAQTTLSGEHAAAKSPQKQD